MHMVLVVSVTGECAPRFYHGLLDVWIDRHPVNLWSRCQSQALSTTARILLDGTLRASCLT